jgi:hypothetical protein
MVVQLYCCNFFFLANWPASSSPINTEREKEIERERERERETEIERERKRERERERDRDRERENNLEKNSIIVECWNAMNSSRRPRKNAKIAYVAAASGLSQVAARYLTRYSLLEMIENVPHLFFRVFPLKLYVVFLYHSWTGEKFHLMTYVGQ